MPDKLQAFLQSMAQQGSSGTGTSDISHMLSDFLWFQYMPLIAIPIDLTTTIQFAGVSNNEITIVSYTTPALYEGVIKWVGQDADQPAVFNNSIWYLRIDQQAAPHWSGVNVQKGSTINPTPETIQITPNKGISLTCVLGTGTGINFPVNIAGRIKGWVWMKEQRRAA